MLPNESILNYPGVYEAVGGVNRPVVLNQQGNPEGTLDPSTKADNLIGGPKAASPWATLQKPETNKSAWELI